MGLMKKLTSAIVASSLVFSLVGSAFAAYTPAAGETAGTRMQKLGILLGKSGGDLALNSEITRAELVTVIVRAFGKEEDAKLLKGSTAFPDIANHWASGNIAMAAALVEKAGGDAIGMPDGKFNPDGKLTPAQAVAFLMKFVGVKRDATKAWPQDYLSAAANAGIITAEDSALIAPMLNQNATRGLVFYMFDRAFSTYMLPSGKTFYTGNVDPVLPTLTVAKVDATTVDNKVTITGKATDNIATGLQVFVGANKATLNADGSFSYTYDLPELKDYDITVTAQDLAGNKATAPVKVTRTTGSAATVEAKLSAELLKAGMTADLAVTVKDKSGNVIKDAAYDVAVAGDIGTYAAGKFTAAAKPATGSLTITSGTATTKLDVAVVAGDLAKIVVTPATTNVAVGTPVQFTAKGQDAAGNDLAGALNVNWTKTGGVIDAQGNFVGTASGNYTVTATANGVSGTAAVTVFGQAVAVKLAAVPDLVANASSTQTVTASVVDAAGNVVTGYNGTITLSSSNNGVATLNATSVTAVNGVATATLKSAAKSSTTTTFAVSASASGLTGATATVKATAQTLTSISATIDTPTLGADGYSSTTVTYKELDQAGVELAAANYVQIDMNLTNSNSSVVTVPATTQIAAAGGAKAVTINSKSAAEGQATITAAVTTSGKTGISVGTATVTTMAVGVPANIVIDTVDAAKVQATGVAAADTEQDIVVRVVDAKGNQVTNPTLNGYVTLTISADATNGSKITWKGDVKSGSPSNGKFTFTALNTVIGDNDVTYTVKATYDADGKDGNQATATDLATKTATGHWLPGPVAGLTLTGSPRPDTKIVLAADGVATGTLKATLADSKGNAINEGSYTVSFFKTSGGDNNATADFTDNKATAVTSAGAATVTITATKAVATDTFQASVKLDSGATIVSNTISADTKIMGVVTKSAWVAKPTFTAGTATNVKVVVKDAGDVTVTTDNGRAVTITAAKHSDGTQLGTFTGTTVNGIATIPVTLTWASYSDTADLTVTVDGAAAPTDNTNATSLTANPAAATQVAVKADAATLAADGVSKAKLTVSLKDQYGNYVKAAAKTTVTLKLDGTSYAKFEGATDTTTVDIAAASYSGSTADGTNSLLAKNATPGVVTVTASGPDASGLTSATLQVTTIYGAVTPAQYSINAITDTTVGVDMIVDLYVQDTQGNRVTGYTGKVDITTDSNTADLDLVNADNQKTVTLDVNKGFVEFKVHDTKAETLTMTAANNGGVAITSKSFSGVFTAAKAASLMIETPAYTYVKADGNVVVSYVVDVVDGNKNSGNTVTSANGTVKVEITSGADYATVLTPTINIAGGVGTFQLQTKYRESDGVVTVKVSTSDMFVSGSTPLAADTDASLNVIGVAPVFSGPATFTMADVPNNVPGTVKVKFDRGMLKADVETVSNWIMAKADPDNGDEVLPTFTVSYDSDTTTATLTFAKGWTTGETITILDGVLRDAHSVWTADGFTVTLP